MSLGDESTIEYVTKSVALEIVIGLIGAVILLALGSPQNAIETFFDWTASFFPPQYKILVILGVLSCFILIYKIILDVIIEVTKKWIDSKGKKLD